MSRVLLNRVLRGTGVESPIANDEDADRALRELADQLRYGESLKRSNASWVWLSVAKILKIGPEQVEDLNLAGALDPNRTVGEDIPEAQVDAIANLLSDIRRRTMYEEEEEDFQWEAHEDVEDEESDDIEGSA